MAFRKGQERFISCRGRIMRKFLVWFSVNGLSLVIGLLLLVFNLVDVSMFSTTMVIGSCWSALTLYAVYLSELALEGE